MCCLGTALIRLVLKVANTLAAIGAFILIILASIAIALTSGFDSVFKGDYNSFIVILFFAISIFILSRLGCCGARRENKLCLYLYTIAMFIIFLAQVIITLILLTMSDEQIKQMFGDDLAQSFANYESDTRIKRTFDVIQKHWH